jgi:molybdopterin-containing oxidoreductase family membrane subunit
MLFWYGRLPREIQLLKLMFYGEYTWALVVAIICCFMIPLGALMWNNVRKSIRGPIIVASIILFGNFINQIRLFVSTWALPDNVGVRHMLPDEMIPAFTWPTLTDILIVPGLIAGCVFVYLIALRFVPAISLWEVAEGTLYRKRVPYLSGHVTVVAKPE